MFGTDLLYRSDGWGERFGFLRWLDVQPPPMPVRDREGVDEGIPLRGGRSGNRNPSSRWANHSENFIIFMPVCSPAACENKKKPGDPILVPRGSGKHYPGFRQENVSMLAHGGRPHLGTNGRSAQICSGHIDPTHQNALRRHGPRAPRHRPILRRSPPSLATRPTTGPLRPRCTTSRSLAADDAGRVGAAA